MNTVFENELFKGKAKKINLISNNIVYGPEPDEVDTVEQHLTIEAEGNAWVKRLSSAEEVIEESHLHIEPEKATGILDIVAGRFTNDIVNIMIQHAGSWRLTITDDKGDEYKYSGILFAPIEPLADGLSELLQETFERDDLLGMNGRDEK